MIARSAVTLVDRCIEPASSDSRSSVRDELAKGLGPLSNSQPSVGTRLARAPPGMGHAEPKPVAYALWRRPEMPMRRPISFAVSDLGRSTIFYDAALGALGYVRVWSFPDAVGYGARGGSDKFALKKREAEVATPGAGFHLAFSAPSREAVDAFLAEALDHDNSSSSAASAAALDGTGVRAAVRNPIAKGPLSWSQRCCARWMTA